MPSASKSRSDSLGYRPRSDTRQGIDFSKKFLPDGLSKVDQLPFLSADQKRFYSHVQGRTYANMFALVERFIGAKVTDLSRTHALGDQVAFEALVRLTDEELKHQELFRRLELKVAPGMPSGYVFVQSRIKSQMQCLLPRRGPYSH